MNPGTRRYPIGPLLDVMVGRGMSRTAAARLLGMSGSSLQDATRLGLLVKAADRCAMKAGLHPVEVWPSWMDDVLEDHGRDCAECGDRFLPQRKDSRFCGRVCADRFHNRVCSANYRSTPAGRAAKRAASQRYYAECAEYVRAARRRRYAANRDVELAKKREKYAADAEYRRRMVEAQRRRAAERRDEAA